tara:strand:+ start:1113 stop:1517 length:405 start_codon:yes stop_codon:yes gene_type:complete
MSIKLINNEKRYYEFIRVLRNMKSVMMGFIEQHFISPQEHAIFMEKYAHHYYICVLNDDTPVGFVGEIDGDLRVATHPDFQGKGYGSFMIEEMMKKSPQSYAKVKIKNKASLRMFEKCGFKKIYYILEKTNNAS